MLSNQLIYRWQPTLKKPSALKKVNYAYLLGDILVVRWSRSAITVQPAIFYENLGELPLIQWPKHYRDRITALTGYFESDGKLIVSFTATKTGARFETDGKTTITFSGIKQPTVFESDGATVITFNAATSAQFYSNGKTVITFAGTIGVKFESDGATDITFIASNVAQPVDCATGSGTLPTPASETNYVF